MKLNALSVQLRESLSVGARDDLRSLVEYLQTFDVRVRALDLFPAPPDNTETQGLYHLIRELYDLSHDIPESSAASLWFEQQVSLARQAFLDGKRRHTNNTKRTNTIAATVAGATVFAAIASVAGATPNIPTIELPVSMPGWLQDLTTGDETNQSKADPANQESPRVEYAPVSSIHPAVFLSERADAPIANTNSSDESERGFPHANIPEQALGAPPQVAISLPITVSRAGAPVTPQNPAATSAPSMPSLEPETLSPPAAADAVQLIGQPLDPAPKGDSTANQGSAGLPPSALENRMAGVKKELPDQAKAEDLDVIAGGTNNDGSLPPSASDQAQSNQAGGPGNSENREAPGHLFDNGPAKGRGSGTRSI